MKCAHVLASITKVVLFHVITVLWSIFDQQAYLYSLAFTMDKFPFGNVLAQQNTVPSVNLNGRFVKIFVVFC